MDIQKLIYYPVVKKYPGGKAIQKASLIPETTNYNDLQLTVPKLTCINCTQNIVMIQSALSVKLNNLTLPLIPQFNEKHTKMVLS